MKLTNKPSAENVQKLKTYVKGLPAKSPFSMLAKYEQQLVDNNITVRAIVKVCDTDTHYHINKAEGLTNKNWYRIFNMDDINDIPDNYFNIILWSDCDPEIELRNITTIFPKLKDHGKIYFDKLDSSLNAIFDKCFSKKDLYNARENYKMLIDNLLDNMIENNNYSIVRKKINDHDYITIIKGKLSFSPSDSLADELDKIDQDLLSEYPTVQLSPSELRNFKNRIFDIVADRNLSSINTSYKDMCDELALQKDLPRCDVYGAHQQYITTEHTDLVSDAIINIRDRINASIGMGIMDVDTIVSELKDIVSTKIAEEKTIENVIREFAENAISAETENNTTKEIALQTNLTDLDDEDTIDFEEDDEDTIDFEDEEEDEEEEYPIVEAPSKLIPPIFLPGLANIGGYSCFMDSVLFSILLPKKGYFSRHILDKEITAKLVKNCSNYDNDPNDGIEYIKNMQTELGKLANIIRGHELPDVTCYPIAQQLQKCNPFTEYLMSGDQQDDSEFLRAIAQIFNIVPTKLVRSREVSDNKKDWIVTSIKTEREVILELDLQINDKKIEPASWYQKININDYENVNITDWPRGPDPNDEITEKPYRYSREKVTIESSNALIFHAPRRQAIQNGTSIKYVKNTSVVDFSAYIEKQDTEKLYELQVVTNHAGSAYGGHYTAYFKYKGRWYHYDDTKSGYSRVSAVGWDEVKKSGKKNGSLYMYFPRAK